MLVPIPALQDNYIWVYQKDNFPAIVVDIPDLAPLYSFIQAHSISVGALLLTHHHNDHTQGATLFKQYYPEVPIYGPEETALKGATHILQESSQFDIDGYHIRVIATGGHTEQHISYLIDNNLFCGDSLFAAGCGRVFTKNYAQMFDGLQRLKQLPKDTQICCGHEYTLSNLAFAQQVLPHSTELKEFIQFAQALRAENRPTLPTTLALEKKINPFLQAETLEKFIQLRQAKDIF